MKHINFNAIEHKNMLISTAQDKFTTAAGDFGTLELVEATTLKRGPEEGKLANMGYKPEQTTSAKHLSYFLNFTVNSRSSSTSKTPFKQQGLRKFNQYPKPDLTLPENRLIPFLEVLKHVAH